MTAAGYLYSAAITIACTAIFSGYLVCYLACRKKTYLLLMALFALYLISEVARILTSLSRSGPTELPFGVPQIWYFLCCAIFFLLSREQAGRSARRWEYFLLIPVAAASCFPRSILAAYIGVFTYGLWKLYPVRKADRRSCGMLWAVALLDGAFLLLLLPQLRHEIPPLIQTALEDLPLYITAVFAVADVVSTLRHFYESRAETRIKPRQDIEPASETLVDRAARIAAKYGLSPKETEVFLLLCHGSSVQEIADRLFISVGTAKVHIHSSYQKLGISNRRQINQLLFEKADPSDCG